MLDDAGMTEKIAPDAEFTRFMSQLGESAKLHPSPWAHSWDGNGAPVGVAKRDLDAADAESARAGRKDDAGKLDWTLLPESIVLPMAGDGHDPTVEEAVYVLLFGDRSDLMRFANNSGMLIPEMLEETVRVLAFGADKYGRDNWRSVHDAVRRYRAAAMRHFMEDWRSMSRDDDARDEESGLLHIAHMFACILFLGCLLEDA